MTDKSPATTEEISVLLESLDRLLKELSIDIEGHIWWRSPDGSLEIGQERDELCRAVVRALITLNAPEIIRQAISEREEADRRTLSLIDAMECVAAHNSPCHGTTIEKLESCIRTARSALDSPSIRAHRWGNPPWA